MRYFLLPVIYADYIKPGFLRDLVGFDVCICGPYQVPLFFKVNKEFGLSIVIILSGFYFHEHQRVAFFSNQIDFEFLKPPIAIADGVALRLKIFLSLLFSFLSKIRGILSHILYISY